jgi:flagellar assembly protein FliH
MLCKIADATQLAEPVAWRSTGPAGPASSTRSARLADIPAKPGQGAAAENDEGARFAEMAQARQMGLQEGLRQAREMAGAELQAASDRLARTLGDLAQVKRKIRNDAEHEVVRLALAVARRILYRELATDPESIQGIVHAALQKLQNREIARARVYPAAAAAVRAALERAGANPAIEIVADASLEVGAILFETSLGELDASVETQLQEIQRGFADRLALR